MRDIKFRANTPYGMLSVTTIHFDLLIAYGIPIGAKDWSSDDFEFGLEEINLMQYTGLKDSEGVEIYEGDILKSSYTDRGHVVLFKNGKFVIQHSKNCCPPYKTSLEEAGNEDGIGWQKIIGNIYENKELLT